MLNDPDASRVAEITAVCFAAIAHCEQALHEARRAELAVKPIRDPGAGVSHDRESVENLLRVLEVDHAKIDAEIVKIQPAENFLLDAPTMSADELLAALDKVAAADSSYPLESTAMPHWLAPFVTRAQLLDAWFEPIFNLDMELNAAQVEFRDAFDLDGYVLLSDGAILLPRRRQSWRADQDDTADCLGLFARHLRNLAYMPSRLNCDDPDALTCPGKPISAEYQLWTDSYLQAHPMPAEPVIAVAPLAECGEDVDFVPGACRRKYALRLTYDETRFAETLTRALEKDVHILLTPEMALPEGDPENFDARMRELILDVRTKHYERSKQVGKLRLVVVGVLGGMRADGYHRNYAAVFDANGDQPQGFRQLKLSHWNLTRAEQDRFGITHHQASCGMLSDPITENSLPASCLSVLEIPGVGRMATLICADMSQNNPGDWLSLNAVLDWLYAPIMDKSTCWHTSDQMKASRPWIVRRSYRSARLTRTLVITTNSMTLSHWVNDENQRTESTWPQYTEVGVGLAIDGRRDPPSYNHLSVDINKRDVIELFACPMSDWKPFPPPP